MLWRLERIKSRMVFWKLRKVKFNLNHTICHIQTAVNIGTIV